MGKIWNSFGLSTKILVTVITMVCLVCAVNFYVFLRQFRKDMIQEMTEQGAAFTAVADEAKGPMPRTSSPPAPLTPRPS